MASIEFQICLRGVLYTQGSHSINVKHRIYTSQMIVKDIKLLVFDTHTQKKQILKCGSKI